MLEALLFDVDGVVAETEDMHRRAFNEAFERSGVPLAWDAAEYRRLLAVHGGKERIECSAAERGLRLSPGTIDRLHAVKTRVYSDILVGEGAPWRPGVARLIDEAPRRGVKLGIATTTSLANLDPLFEPVLGDRWRGAFGAIVSGQDVARKKPAPDVYLEAVRRLGVQAHRTIAVEDSAAGVKSARAAGCAVVATRSCWHPDANLTQADVQLEHLGDADNPWEFPHRLFHRRWLSIHALIVWHRQLEAVIDGNEALA